jgi:hypothetical protein
MSTKVDVDTSLSTTDYLIAGGLLAGIMFIMSSYGFTVSNLTSIVSALSLTVLALLLWQLLTKPSNVSKFVDNNQLFAIIGTGVVSLTLAMSLFSVWSVKSMHS